MTTNPVVRTLECGCTYTTDGQRHWCPSCKDALGGYPAVKLHPRTPLCDAAPAMLAALEMFLQIDDQHADNCRSLPTWASGADEVGPCDCRYGFARAALAKAASPQAP